jgi:PTS system nitrogen regulatory IIA component
LHLGDYIKPEFILTDLEIKDKKELFEFLSKKISTSPFLENTPYYGEPEKIKNVLWESENKQTTGLGKGLAFPHARLLELKKLAILIAILKKPIEYDSIDEQPINFVFLVLTPQKKPTLALKAFSLIAQLLNNPEGKKVFFNGDSEKIYYFICSKNAVIDSPIRASDIMQKTKFTIYPDTPLSKVTSIMFQNKTDTTCVLNKEHQVVGEINCDLLFNLGIPPFINRLKSISFISEFDPFEKYFDLEYKMTAEDIMSKNFCLMEKNASLLEIVFALTVLKYFKIYIVDKEKKLLGEISRICVLDRILNL